MEVFLFLGILLKSCGEFIFFRGFLFGVLKLWLCVGVDIFEYWIVWIEFLEFKFKEVVGEDNLVEEFVMVELLYLNEILFFVVLFSVDSGVFLIVIWFIIWFDFNLRLNFN